MNDAVARFSGYLSLIRLDRPIGTLLLLWPTLWALWLAAGGLPAPRLLAIFVAGTFLTRSAGCILNDLADRDFDGAVERTRNRPLVTGAVSPSGALVFAALLGSAALALVLLTNTLTVLLACFGAMLAACYPFMKRFTHLPQLVLGVAFSWGIPMAFAAVRGELPLELWLIFAANFLWTVAYDTEYAMVDREDDLKVGIKSTAILFGERDRQVIAALHVLALLVLLVVGRQFGLGVVYYLGLAVAAGLFLYQHRLTRGRASAGCFRAFLNNNRVGMAIFAGIALDLL